MTTWIGYQQEGKLPYRVHYVSGRFWISLDCLSYGDYDSSCDVERANVRWLEEKHEGKTEMLSYELFERGVEWRYNQALGHSEDIPVEIGEDTELILLSGDYGSISAWLPWSEENDELLSSLLDYPSIDDEMVWLVNAEMEKECWHDWIKRDLIDAAFPDNPDMREKLMVIDDDSLYDYYLGIKEQKNEYFEVQAGGVGWINVERLAPLFRENIGNYFRS